LTLGSAILFAGLVASLASFILAYVEATEFQDDMLRQIALLATHSTRSLPPLIDAPILPRTESVLSDSESRISVIRLPGEPRPGWLDGDLTSGFRTLETDRGRLRVFVQPGPAGKTTIVAQPTESRDEIASNSALRTLAPLLLLLPVMAWLIPHIVRRELGPVSRLAGYLDAQPADRPRPLTDEGIPDEITSFVHAINRLLERIGVLMDQQRRFISDAAHELRSPLTALSIQAQNLTQVASVETLRERITPLLAGIERARKLTEQLLSLARAQAGEARITEVDVSALARELIAEYLPVAEAKGIDLGLEEATQLKIEAAPETLRLILKNGLENALKYAPKNGEVTLRLDANGGSTIIEIIDNGPGIPLTERARVFDPFYRMAGTVGEGSGLGLAIAREAAAHQGGNLYLLDRPQGSGVLFRYRQGSEVEKFAVE